jgi:hypothetical protein
MRGRMNRKRREQKGNEDRKSFDKALLKIDTTTTMTTDERPRD